MQEQRAAIESRLGESISQNTNPLIELDPMALLEHEALHAQAASDPMAMLEHETQTDPIEQLERAGEAVVNDVGGRDVDDDNAMEADAKEEILAPPSSGSLPSGPLTREVVKLPVFAQVRQADEEISDDSESRSKKKKKKKRLPKPQKKKSKRTSSKRESQDVDVATLQERNRKAKVEDLIAKAKPRNADKQDQGLEHLTPLERMLLRREEIAETTVIESRALGHR